MSTEILKNDDVFVPSRPRPLWRNRDYLLLVGGQAVSALGSQISFIAFPLLFFALTHSAVQTGLIGSLRTLPIALLTLPAGALVDRWDRKRLMIFCDIGRALALGSIPVAMLFGQLSYLQLYIVSLIEGTLFAFFTLAETACLPRIVATEQLPTATGQNEFLLSGSTLLGPALGPVLYGMAQSIPFLADAISYAISAISLFFMQVRFQEERVNVVSSKLWDDIKEGFVWLWRNPLMRFIALHTFGMATPCYGYVLIIILLAQNMHVSNFTLGLIFATSGVGSLVGALIAGPLQKRFGFGKLFIASTWIWALTWLVYVLAPNPLLLGIANALSFIIVPIYMVVQYSYRLATIPDHLQGRVNGVFRLLAFSGQPLGMALTGILLQAMGPIYTVIVLFIPQLILAIAVTLNKRVRSISRIEALDPH